MPKKPFKTLDELRAIPFLSISDACRVTGLSEGFLRAGCKAGTVPHAQAGSKYLVNVPALLRLLGADSSEA